MNLIQQAEQLKMLPDSQVAQMMERPSSVPPWLAVAEMQRRETMRKAYQAHVGENQESVVQQMAQQQQMAPQTQRMQHGGTTKVGGGIEKVSDLSDYEQSTMPEPSDQPLSFAERAWPLQNPPEFASVPVSIPAPEVGIAALANDPPWKRLSKEELQAEYGKASSLDEWHARYKKAQGTTRYEALLQEAQARETKHRNKKSSIGDILMAAGLSMAASKSPNMLGAIAEGGIGALNMYGSERNRNQGLADMALRDRLNIAKDQQQSDDYIMRDAMQSQIAEERGIASMMQAGEANRRAEWRTDIQNNQARADRAAAVAAAAALAAAADKKEDKKAAEARAAAAALAAAQMKDNQLNRDMQWAIAKLNSAKERGGLTPEQTQIKQRLDSIIDFTKSAQVALNAAAKGMLDPTATPAEQKAHKLDYDEALATHKRYQTAGTKLMEELGILEKPTPSPPKMTLAELEAAAQQPAAGIAAIEKPKTTADYANEYLGQGMSREEAAKLSGAEIMYNRNGVPVGFKPVVEPINFHQKGAVQRRGR